MGERNYQLVIIGGGPGGYTAAIRAAQLGMKTALVDRRAALGGTCLNVGCIPSKALLESSALYHRVNSGLAEHGIDSNGLSLNLAAMMARKDSIVESLTKGVAGLLKANGVDTFCAQARLTGPRQVALSPREESRGRELSDALRQGSEVPGTLNGERVILASGSEAVELAGAAFDGHRVISSTEALSLDSVPGRMLVIGAGAIGLEMAALWSRLGSQVKVAEIEKQIVPGADTRSATLLQRSLKKRGIAFSLETEAHVLERNPEGLRVELKRRGKEKTEEFDLLLVAAGRKAAVDGLGLDLLGVERDENGRLVVDERYRSNVPGLYAIGDLIPGPMLAHKAAEEGVACVELMAGLDSQVNYAAMPSVIYTEPELASVGLSEQAAAEAGVEVKTGCFAVRASGRARCGGHLDGEVKIVAEAASDALLGVHIVAPHASELIAEACLAIQMHASVADLASTIHAHPTLAECTKEAALAVHGRALNASSQP